jgi:hypothetical protein
MAFPACTYPFWASESSTLVICSVGLGDEMVIGFFTFTCSVGLGDEMVIGFFTFTGTFEHATTANRQTTA